MILRITDMSGYHVLLQPRMGLYSVRDFMGKELPGIAIILDECGDMPEDLEEYAVLTVSFGEFISIKNCAYIDVNNCYFAKELLSKGIAEDTGLTKHSGFCQYPLWRFKEDFLKEIGGPNYEEYSRCYDAYMSFNDSADMDAKDALDEQETTGLEMK